MALHQRRQHIVPDRVVESSANQAAIPVHNLDPDAPAPSFPKKSSGTSTSIRNEVAVHFEQAFRHLMKRQVRQDEGIKDRRLGVMFKELRVVGACSRTSLQPTVGSPFYPSTFLRKIREIRHPSIRDILSGFEGVVTPGEMLLVLGRPGSGCSTFLKTIANQCGEYHAVDGQVFYDAFTQKEIHDSFRGDVTYCPEDDIHFPTLTVNQTLSFAVSNRTHATCLLGQTRKDYVEDTTTMLMKVLGLYGSKNSLVGNAQIQGVSGGERKRVSIAEILGSVSPLGAWDNSTRGLDSSTALDFVRTLRFITDVKRTTSILSLYQAGEQIYELFDKVCIIAEGKMAYFGSAKSAKGYFIDMGFEPQNRQTTPDFLVAVTDANGRKIRPGYENIVPRTSAELASRFMASDLGHQNRKAIEQRLRAMSYLSSVTTEGATTTSAYMTSIPHQIKTVMKRHLQVIVTFFLFQPSVTLGDSSQVFQAIFTGTVFLNVPNDTSAYFSRGSILFFSLFFSAITAVAEVPALFLQRPIVLRHQRAALHYPFIQSLAHTIVDIPITLIIQLVFAVIVYFLVGLQRSAAQFFIFYFFIFLTSQTMKSLFRAIAASFKTRLSAIAVSGVFVLLISLSGGYTIPWPTAPKGLRWIMWLNPVWWGFGSLLVNEFHTLHGFCSTLVPQGPGYENVSLANQVCTTVGSQPGDLLVDGNIYVGLTFNFWYGHLWRNFGVICAFYLGFLAVLLVATEYNTSSDFDGAVAADPLTFDIPIKGGMKRLLDDVTGFVAPGKLTALMGGSGVGKTTLLNVLAQRIGAGVVSGGRFVNGEPLPIDFEAQMQVGYCQQLDTHLPNATVREALLFSANLRQPQSVPHAEKEAYVGKCLQMCGLEAYADAIVDSLGVEHRKRTTIAVELAAKPKLLLFLDEPTSGLDSQSAWAIVQFLRELADHGQTILCTIHQPSAELFQVFDRLLLLHKGGRTVYFGDIGENSSAMLNYFESNGAPRCGPDANPAEYMLDVIGAGATVSTTDWCDVWKRSSEATQLQVQIERIHEHGHTRPRQLSVRKSVFATSWSHQFVALTQRNFRAYWRTPTYIRSQSIFLGLVLCVSLGHQLMAVYIDIRIVYEIRERSSRMYHWTALVMSQLVVELPLEHYKCGNVLFLLVLDRYTFLMISVAFPLYYTTLEHAIASMAPTAPIASLYLVTLFIFLVIFDGVIQPFIELNWWKWMYRVSPFAYIIEGLLGQELYMGPFMEFAGGYLTNPEAAEGCQYCPYRTADQYMYSRFNIKDSDHWRNLGIVFGFVAFNIIAVFWFTYLMRIRTVGVFTSLRQKLIRGT
ncbi:P-loop containing nucleoside triphosphate hydrolase protein [Suillus variegatus]|nr:P-loop containing nucleoside triphosphate hydrolase protein [Suillus variegatus]